MHSVVPISYSQLNLRQFIYTRRPATGVLSGSGTALWEPALGQHLRSLAALLQQRSPAPRPPPQRRTPAVGGGGASAAACILGATRPAIDRPKIPQEYRWSSAD